MTLSTLITLFFVLLLWALAWQLRWRKARQTLLLGASYLFYANWGLGFLSILIASSLLNYAWGSVLRRRPTAGHLLWIGVALNLLLLGFFKYLPSLSELGLASSPDFFRQIVMPVGISFWTFQGISYLFDVYREEESDPSLLEFCLYMAFWPTVLSGPICRLSNMLPQFRSPVSFTRDNLAIGLLRVIQGLLMTFVLAQLLGFGWNTGEGVVAGFDKVKGGWGGVDVWLLAVGFGFQLFFDFAGYSHIVIGTARLFGIRLEENFDRPYFSTTPSLFWTRWHMSLSFWIRDYVFLPLAAARRESYWPYAALVISMTLFGLWHGAMATFVVWGMYHGLLLVLHRLGQQFGQRVSFRWPTPLVEFLSWATTFCLVSLGWIFFRAHDLTQALMMLRSVLSPAAYLQFAMPVGFYVLISFVVGGYFSYAAIEALLAYWYARRQGKLTNAPEPALRVRPLAEIMEFGSARMAWWSFSMVIAMAMVIGLAIYDQSGSIAVTPFMYAGF